MRTSFLLAALAIAGSASAQTDWARYRVWIDSPEQAQRLADCHLGLYSDNIQMPATDMIVGPGQLPELWRLNLRYQLVSRLERPDRYKDYVRTQAFDYQNQYGRLADIYQQMDDWMAANPRYVRREEVGRSIENRPIYAYRLWNPDSFALNEPPPKTVVVMTLIHAREWVSGSVGLYLADQILRQMRLSPAFMRRMNRLQVYFIPCHNPDGYEYTWTNNRLWRKNRRRNSNGSYGVDLNRNYSTGWGQNGGSSSDPSSEVYRGTAAFSEPETIAVRDWSSAVHANNNIVGHIDYHSYSQLVMWPWGYTTTQHPQNSTLQTICSNYRNAMTNGGGAPYTIGQIARVLYIASGVTVDWYIQTFGSKAITIELRDTGQYGFELPTNQILPTCRENWNGFSNYLQQLAP